MIDNPKYGDRKRTSDRRVGERRRYYPGEERRPRFGERRQTYPGAGRKFRKAVPRV